MLPSCATKKAFITLADRQGEVNGHASGNHELVHARDTLGSGKRRAISNPAKTPWISSGGVFDSNGLGRIEVMGPDPGHTTQKHDDEEGDRPDDELDAAGNTPNPAGIGDLALDARNHQAKAERRGDRRHDDGEHDRERGLSGSSFLQSR